MPKELDEILKELEAAEKEFKEKCDLYGIEEKRRKKKEEALEEVSSEV